MWYTTPVQNPVQQLQSQKSESPAKLNGPVTVVSTMTCALLKIIGRPASQNETQIRQRGLFSDSQPSIVVSVRLGRAVVDGVYVLLSTFNCRLSTALPPSTII